VFTVTCDQDHVLSLRQDGRALPVSGAYVRHLCAQRGLDLMQGDHQLVDAEFTRDAIEEALGQLSYEIAQAISTRRALLAILNAANKPPATAA